MSLLSSENGVQLQVPLSPLVRRFHVNVLKEIINFDTLLALSDDGVRSVIAALVALNFHLRYPESLIIVVCADASRREMMKSALTEFSMPVKKVLTLKKERGNNVRLPEEKGCVVFMSQNAISSLDNALKKADLKLVIIDDAEKAHGNSTHSKVVRLLNQRQEDFRVLGLSRKLDLSKPVPVRAVVSNLMINKMFLKDSFDKNYMDGVLLDDTMHHEVEQLTKFKSLIESLGDGIETYSQKLYMSSVLREFRPDVLMYSQLDEWRKQAITTVFADDAKLVYSLIQSYKHLVLGGLHSFYLYVTAIKIASERFRTAFEKNVGLRTVYNFAHEKFSNLEPLNTDEQIQLFMEYNPKFEPVARILQMDFETNKNVALVTWSPFTVQSLKVFCKLRFEDKKIAISIYNEFPEEFEYCLNTNFRSEYSSLEGKDVDIFIKTGHLDYKSKRVYKRVISMDLLSASQLRMKIGHFKDYVRMKPYESVDSQFFSQWLNMPAVKYHFIKEAFSMQHRPNKVDKFDVTSFPQEFAPKLVDRRRDSEDFVEQEPCNRKRPASAPISDLLT